MFYSVFGGFILKEHFNLDAKARCGLAAFYVRDDDSVILFGEIHDGAVTGQLNSFHCWLEVDGWIIDFMAPAFPEVAQNESIPPKMFQKPVSAMVANINDMKQVGDFFLSSDPCDSQQRLQFFNESQGYTDLAQICSRWFRKYPKKMMDKINIANEKGHLMEVFLEGPRVKSTW